MTVTLPFPSQRHSYPDDELLAVNAELEHAPASKIIAWAVEAFGPHLCLTASMNDAVLIDLAVQVDPAIEVVFIDTGSHFPETPATAGGWRRRYGITMQLLPATEDTEVLWTADTQTQKERVGEE